MQTSAPPDTAVGNLATMSRVDEILGVLSDTGEPSTLAEVARRTGLPKSTAHRLMSKMTDLGWLSRHGNEYVIGTRLLTVGIGARHRAVLRDKALPYMHDLVRATAGTAHLAVYAGGSVLCVEKVFGTDSPPIRSRVGETMPIHVTGVGKVLLAYASEATREATMSEIDVAAVPALRRDLATVRRAGVAFDRRSGEMVPRCVAAPVSRSGDVVAAISVSMPARASNTSALGARVRHVAGALGRALTEVAQR